MSVQVGSTTRGKRRSRVEQEKSIFQLKSGAHAGEFLVKINKGATDPITGQLKDKRYGPFADLDEAIAARDDHFAKIKLHVEITPGRAPKDMTLKQWSDHYLDVVIVLNGNGLNSQSKYRRVFEQHILPELGHIALVDLTTTIIQTWVRNLRKRTGAAMVTYCIKRLKACLSAATLDPKTTGITINPAEGKKVPNKIPTPRTATYEGSLDDLPKMEAVAGEGHLAPMLRFDTDSGLRVSELAALTWADVLWDSAEVILRWHLVTSGDRARGDLQTAFLPGTKGHDGQFQRVALSSRAVEALRLVHKRLRDLQGPGWKAGKRTEVFYAQDAQATDGEHYVVPTDPCDPEGLVFPSEDGTPNTTAALSDFVQRVAEKAGIYKTIHLLRHDCGSFMLHSNVPLTVVSAHLRHGNIAVTAKTYAHVLPEGKRLGAEALDRLWAAHEAQAEAV